MQTFLMKCEGSSMFFSCSPTQFPLDTMHFQVSPNLGESLFETLGFVSLLWCIHLSSSEMFMASDSSFIPHSCYFFAMLLSWAEFLSMEIALGLNI